MGTDIHFPSDAIGRFCRENGIRRLSVFGSALGPRFGPDSDVDLLVEFEPGRIPGMLGIARLERELAAMFGGRKVDLRTPEDLSPYFRDKVLAEAQTHYAS